MAGFNKFTLYEWDGMSGVKENEKTDIPGLRYGGILKSPLAEGQKVYKGVECSGRATCPECGEAAKWRGNTVLTPLDNFRLLDECLIFGLCGRGHMWPLGTKKVDEEIEPFKK